MPVNPVHLVTVSSVIKVWMISIKAFTQMEHVRERSHVNDKTASCVLMKISRKESNNFQLRLLYWSTSQGCLCLHAFVRRDVGILFSFRTTQRRVTSAVVWFKIVLDKIALEQDCVHT